MLCKSLNEFYCFCTKRRIVLVLSLSLLYNITSRQKSVYITNNYKMQTCVVTTEIIVETASTQSPHLSLSSPNHAYPPEAAACLTFAIMPWLFFNSSATFVCAGMHPRTIEFSFAYSWTLYKWIRPNVLFYYVSPFLFSIMFVRFIHIFGCSYSSFILIPIWLCWSYIQDVQQLYILSTLI